MSHQPLLHSLETTWLLLLFLNSIDLENSVTNKSLFTLRYLSDIIFVFIYNRHTCSLHINLKLTADQSFYF